MNALNPVLRISDQLGDALDAHLDLDTGAKRAPGWASSSTSSESRASG